MLISMYGGCWVVLRFLAYISIMGAVVRSFVWCRVVLWWWCACELTVRFGFLMRGESRMLRCVRCFLLVFGA